MKKIVLLLITLISFSGYSQQGRQPRGEKPQGEPRGEMPKREKISIDDQINNMSTQLNLSEIQQLQVREVLVEQEKNHEEFASKKDLLEKSDNEDIKNKINEERKNSDEKFKKILTPEQFTKWSQRKPNDEMGKKEKKEKKNKKKKVKSED